ncbi:MAG: SPFH domain-containing protein, partial [bacterium]
MPAIVFVIVVLFLLLVSAIRVLNEYERGVIFRLGRLIGAKGPGLVLLIPIVDRMQRVSLRTIVLDVPPQDVITRDNVSVQVNAVVYFRVMDPNKAIVAVENFLFATSQLSQTTLRSVLGQQQLDDLLSEREKINQELQKIIDRHTDPWGIKVSMVEVKHLDLPQEMKRIIGRQAEAERERRAKIIAADGEFQAASKLADAAKVMEAHPIALQLRFLQTLVEVGPRTLAAPHDYDARASFMWCATLALNNLISCGVPQDWTTHMIGHELT